MMDAMASRRGAFFSVRQCANLALRYSSFARRLFWVAIIIPTFHHSVVPWDDRGFDS